MVVAIISKNIKYYTASSTLFFITHTLKEPEMLYRSLVASEKAHGCGLFLHSGNPAAATAASAAEPTPVTARVDEMLFRPKKAGSQKLTAQ